MSHRFWFIQKYEEKKKRSRAWAQPERLPNMKRATKMTVDRTWLESLKEDYPDAFHDQVPDKWPIETVFVDGQLKLQRQKDMVKWDSLLAVFRNNIRRHFAEGARTVIMAFDNYAHTPASKAPTQRKRVYGGGDVMKFDERVALPAMIPPNYEKLLMNRVFKGKVIQLIVSHIPDMFKLSGRQRLIVDYKENPVVFTADGEVREIVLDRRLGECDVKFMHYLQMGNLELDACDSDYVIIAMNQIERLQQLKLSVPRIFVKRIKLNLNKKRARGETAPPSVSSRQRVYEFADANTLVKRVQDKLSVIQSTWMPCTQQNIPRGHAIRVLGYLFAVIGSDFTRGLTQVSGKTVWRNLEMIWPAMTCCYDADLSAVVPRLAADALVSTIYRCIVFKKHCANVRGVTYQDVYDHLMRSSLSQSTKTRIQNVSQTACLLRNSNWVLRYWHDAVTCPDAVQAQYGYVYNARGAVHFDEHASLESLERLELEQE
jgi:hypothetical protein